MSQVANRRWHLSRCLPKTSAIITAYASKLLIFFPWSWFLIWMSVGKSPILHGWTLRCCWCLTSLAYLCMVSKFSAFNDLRSCSSSSFAAVSLLYFSIQYSSFSFTICMGREWCSAWCKECTGERFAITWPAFRMVVRVLYIVSAGQCFLLILKGSNP